jgi:hypothetical protein
MLRQDVQELLGAGMVGIKDTMELFADRGPEEARKRPGRGPEEARKLLDPPLHWTRPH